MDKRKNQTHALLKCKGIVQSTQNNKMEGSLKEKSSCKIIS